MCIRDRYTELVTSIGALPMILTWDEHDFITAAVSHLPHIVAASLVNVVKKLDSPLEHMKTIAAGGFKDITRIASSSPHMWQQICLENPEHISKVLDEYIRLIVQAKYLVDQKDANGLDVYKRQFYTTDIHIYRKIFLRFFLRN